MRIVCWQTILIKYYTLFFLNIRKMLQNLSSAAVVIVALRINPLYMGTLANSEDPDQML